MSRDIERLYQALRQLESGVGGKRLVAECTSKRGWPTSGVYFFFESDELRRSTREERVVRMGTHGVSRGSKATLWTRIRAHRGTRAGLGNHRGSIFRHHVGVALAAKYPDIMVGSWTTLKSIDSSQRKVEEDLERRVSAYIGSMRVLWLGIEGEAGPTSDRAYIERNVIGMLTGKAGPVDPPSPGWLGAFSPDHRIRLSGLWNLDHLHYPYSPDFLDVLYEYVLITTGKQAQPTRAIAPRYWRSESGG